MEEAREELLVRQVAGRAEQDDDLRQFGTDPGRHPRHLSSPPMLLAQRVSSSHATAARQGLTYLAGPMVSPPQSEARPAFEVDSLGQIEPLRPPGRKHARDVRKKQAGTGASATKATWSTWRAWPMSWRRAAPGTTTSRSAWARAARTPSSSCATTRTSPRKSARRSQQQGHG